MATKRKAISKKTRFEVFKRDGFKCQYCGAAAPDVLLEVDHIQPVSKDGAHDVLNFLTACKPCNAGKSDRTISDDSAVTKQRAQVAELQERRAQLEMMLLWRDGLKDIQADQMDIIANAWRQAVDGWHLNDAGLKIAKTLLKKHGLQAVLEAIETAADKYLKRDTEGNLTADVVETVWRKVGCICTIAALPKDEQRLYYIKAILNKRLSFVPYDAMTTLKAAVEAGCAVEEMEMEAKHCRSWWKFNEWLVV